MSLLFVSTMAVAGDAMDIGAIINKSFDAAAPLIKDASAQFFKGQKRLNASCNVRDCEAPWICHNEKCQECQTGDETDLVDGLMCKFPKICMPMPHDKSKKGCINPAEWVNCGGHYAASCKACPGGNDKNYCNGDCEWFDPAANAPKANSPPILKPDGNVAPHAPVYHTYMSAPPAAVEPLPFCRAKATTAAPPNGEGGYKIDCSTTDLQTCRTDRNCIWVWDGSGLDPALKVSRTEPAKGKAVNTLEKKGKCLVLESYLASPAVRLNKKLNKLAANDLEADDDGASRANAICDKHSSRMRDNNKGVCEAEKDAHCVWWNKIGGGKCVHRDPTDLETKDGAKCLLPFYYKDVKYDGCTTEGVDQKNTGKSWCLIDTRNQSILSKSFQHLPGSGDWDWCNDDAPIADGEKDDGDSNDLDEKCLRKLKKQRIKGLDCKGFAAKTSFIKNTPYCIEYPVAAAQCCKAQCEADAPKSSAKSSVLKQRTTQSFLAADNWE